MQTTIGGDRLGSGQKNVVSGKTYERSTHDLSYIWRSSMASGTLVPFMSEVALPGDSWDIELDANVMTLPTLGPLFGSYKVQLDVFEVPVRLYQGKLHMNMLNIGMNMSNIFLPQVRLQALVTGSQTTQEQVHPSSIFSYLNIRGLGRISPSVISQAVSRYFNAIPWLGYWDIYKNYYSNKQETKGWVIHNPMNDANFAGIVECIVTNVSQNYTYAGDLATGNVSLNATDTIQIQMTVNVPAWAWNTKAKFDFDSNTFVTSEGTFTANELFGKIETYYTDQAPQSAVIVFYQYKNKGTGIIQIDQINPLKWFYPEGATVNNKPKLQSFDLTNIDYMRMLILKAVDQPTAFIISSSMAGSNFPYEHALHWGNGGFSITASQEGLGIKTYQSDLFNNWISTEWIDGQNGVAAVTAVSTTGNKFTIDALNLASKVYAMLNRIAISGGTYDDWLDAVYTHERAKSVENPIYHGSLIKELSFEEVVSTAKQENEPLGSLAGRGRLTGKHKGGSIKIKTSEPSYIMGIVSLTPRVDYSQGNKWDTNLKTMNDFHKPALDEIGYQDLITDQMAYFDTLITEPTAQNFVTTFKSAGKQPAWINYMTNVNQAKGNFAQENKDMYMTLNRRYEENIVSGVSQGIKDLTTYIDPSKYNNIFAEESLTSENFWVQIGCTIECRRKMSAKVIPNL